MMVQTREERSEDYMTTRYNVKKEQARVLEELNAIIKSELPIVQKIEWNAFGVQIDDENIIGLGLYYQGLTTLPESIGTLKSLEKLRLSENKLTTLPESISNLSSLNELDLGGNKLTTLPVSIGDLKSLQRLHLYKNQLTILPESIGNLKSLEELSLSSNKLTTFPESFWRLKNLTSLTLSNNFWKDEWEEIDKYDAPKVLEFCRQRAPISVFLSHSKGDEKKYCTIKLMENLQGG